MSLYAAHIRWSLHDGDFRSGRYSRAHAWDFDGVSGIPASASPQLVRAPWSAEAAVDPEEAFVASVASCHMLLFLSLASRAGLDVRAYSDAATGRLGPDAHGAQAITDIWLRPTLVLAEGATADPALVADLHAQAHHRCFIANSIHTRVHVEAA